MSLFRNPAEHAANPPLTWTVIRVDRRFQLRANEAVLNTFDRKRDAEEAKTRGFLVDLYEKESRWYAGKPVHGWKPYSPPPGANLVTAGRGQCPGCGNVTGAPGGLTVVTCAHCSARVTLRQEQMLPPGPYPFPTVTVTAA